MRVVNSGEDIIIATDNGIVLRTPANDISVIGRATQGVRIMKLKPENKVVAVATSEHEDEEETETGDIIENVIAEQIENLQNETESGE